MFFNPLSLTALALKVLLGGFATSRKEQDLRGRV